MPATIEDFREAFPGESKTNQKYPAFSRKNRTRKIFQTLQNFLIPLLKHEENNPMRNYYLQICTAIKEIATVLNENPTVNIKIVEHTDSDGDDKSNLDLSKRRAASVKNSLVKDFSIDETRIKTDGKGESEPIAKNDSAVNKAKNRRVEFLKL